MNLHQTLLRTALAIALLLGASQAPASIMLSLLPSAQNAGLGQTVSLDLAISGIGDHATPSLGGFDLNFNFDPSKLAFTGYTMGNLLGTVGSNEVDYLITPSGNTINLYGLSYLSETQLATLQPSGFSLATLSFQVGNLSSFERTWVSFGAGNKLSDVNGDPLQIDGTNNAVIGNPVPEPPAILLFGLGLALLLRNRRCV